MRTVLKENVTPADAALVIDALDLPGRGGANYIYRITGFDVTSNASMGSQSTTSMLHHTLFIPFQNGTLAQFGNNGVTESALLSIILDRLTAFQEGKFPSEYNERAIAGVKAALKAMSDRTQDRVKRGVEGQYKV